MKPSAFWGPPVTVPRAPVDSVPSVALLSEALERTLMLAVVMTREPTAIDGSLAANVMTPIAADAAEYLPAASYAETA
jgi:hypothetical protein